MPVDSALLAEIDFFKLLGPDDRQALSEVVDYIEIEEGATLFGTGDPGESLFLVRAGEMLGSRGLTVREVAHRVGCRQPAQFAKAFRRHHGASPSTMPSSIANTVQSCE